MDTSALINFKTLISVSDQWAAFKLLEQLVEEGRIAMPRQVVNEASEIAHPDLPGAWAPGVRSRLRYPPDVDYKYLQLVVSASPSRPPGQSRPLGGVAARASCRTIAPEAARELSLS